MKKKSRLIISLLVIVMMLVGTASIAFAARDYGSLANTISTSGFTGTTSRYRDEDLGYTWAFLTTSTAYSSSYYMSPSAATLQWQCCLYSGGTYYKCFTTNASIANHTTSLPDYDSYAGSWSSAYRLKMYNSYGSSVYICGEWAP